MYGDQDDVLVLRYRFLDSNQTTTRNANENSNAQ
jgi:hypothetical protein